MIRGREQGVSSIAYRVERPRRQARLRSRQIQQWDLPDGTQWATFHRTRAGYAIRFPGYADFAVSRSGGSVECHPVPGVARDAIEHIYSNQVLPLALSCAGRLVLHASAVDIGGRGAAFIGVSGRGKSTLAAAFAAKGDAFLCDDGLLVEVRAGRLRGFPSAPSLRLWGDSVASVLGGMHDGRPAPYSPKVHFAAGRRLRHRARALPLDRAYFLGAGRARGITIEPMPRGEALIELVRHSFLIDVESGAMLAAHFEAIAAVARASTFFRLDYPRRFGELDEVRRAIVEHAH